MHAKPLVKRAVGEGGDFRGEMRSSVYFLGVLAVVLASFILLANAGTHDHSHSHEHDHSHDHSHSSHSIKANVPAPSPIKAESLLPPWMHAVVSTLLISIAPLFILMLIPLEKAEENSVILRVLLALAAGGLLGDVFLHLLPHAQAGGNHDHHHSSEGSHTHSLEDLVTGLWVLAGIFIFLAIEKVVRAVHPSGGHDHAHAHTHGSHDSSQSSAVSHGDKQSDKAGDKTVSDGKGNKNYVLRSRKADKKGGGPKKDDSAASDEECEEHETMQVAGWLNLAADFSHNFTDGLAIGATYRVGYGVGVVTTLAVFFHEIPHELGDFAILLQCGLTKKQAILAQLSTAVGALLGTVLGFFATNLAASTQWILPLTAGGFIYVACTTVLPSLLSHSTIKNTLLELFAFVVGVAMMVLISIFEP